QEAPAAEVSEDFSVDADLSRWDITFASDRVDAALIRQPRSIFLTGALEFLGAYLLRDLLRSTQADVHCLISAADAAAAMQQIESHLVLYR
ncbi:SDR family oxidoreductase, partial [Escherichia coli]|nr:SDR family oxidoreductase [Escherichia coli]